MSGGEAADRRSVAVVRCENSGGGKLTVSFDTGESCLLYQKEARRMEIREGAVLSGKNYNRLLSEVLGKRAKQRALYLLERMDRSEARLRQKLSEGGYPPRCIDEAVAYVKKYHYLDDARYAAQLVRSHRDRLSRVQIRRKLLERGIPRELAEQALEQEYCGDEEQKIRRLLEKRHYDAASRDEKEFARTYQYLLRRGFSGADILREMNNFCNSLI